MVVHGVALVVGVVVVLLTLTSALHTVVVFRAGVTRLTWAHFVWIRLVFNKVAHPRRDFLARQVMRWTAAAAAAAEEKLLPPVYRVLLAVLAWAVAQDLELSRAALAEEEQ